MDDIEAQKRINYFDLGRDDFMALEEYLLSGLSDKDLGKAKGGIMDINQMTRPVRMDAGGMLLKDRLAKIDKNIASVRTKPNLFFDLVKQAGFVKKDGSADIKRFNKAAAKVGIDTKDRSASNMNRITKFLNKASTGAYKNVGMFSGKSGLENFASRIKGLIGYYAEKNSAFAKKEFWDDAKKLQRKVNKLKISSAEKVKEVARGLKLKWAVPIGVTSTLLTKIGFGKALPVVGHLITTEMGSGELPKEGTQEYEELMQGLNEEDEKGLEVTVPLPTQEKETVPTERFKGGGMADIYDMTKPLGYANGGFEDRMSMLKKAMTDTEATRRADMATGDPEMESSSTYGTITEDNILDVAMKIARQQRDTSEENINLIIRQLMALTPSMEQTIRKELTPASTQGLQYLFDKLNVATGRKSDPRLNRSVGFGRVE